MKKIRVDREKCIGCGLCVSVAEKTFRLDKEGKAEIVTEAVDEEEKVQEAIESCPVGAIVWVEEEK